MKPTPTYFTPDKKKILSEVWLKRLKEEKEIVIVTKGVAFKITQVDYKGELFK